MVALALIMGGVMVAQPCAEAAVLSGLRAGHPRLIMLEQDWSRLKTGIRRPGELKAVYQRLYKQAEKLLGKPPVKYNIPDGVRLLGVSRECLRRMYLLDLVWQLSGERRFAERACKNLEAAARFPDWNPKHFLDTAEMSHAFGIGYDWLYDFLSPARRELIRKALVEKGIMPYLEGHQKKSWWSRAKHNWGQVCHGGVGVGALALAGEEPKLAAEVLTKAFAGMVAPMKAYSPDGGIAEGPGYWGYATRYAVYFLAAAQSALGTDRGLSKTPGFAEAGFFRMHAVGPLGLTFNFADAHDRAGAAEEMYWLAERFNQRVFARHALATVRWPSPFSLIWGSGFIARGEKHLSGRVPLAARFSGVDVVFLRSAWDDERAIFVGFKGGDNAANHSHLDLGSFVLDALGQRWALDLGPDNYNLPGYWDRAGKRWTYYRLKSEGHNTLTFDGSNQAPRAKAPVVAFSASRSRSHAVVDLTAAYADEASSVRRGIALLGRKRVLIQDEWKCSKPRDVDWFFHTKAKIKGKGSRIELTLGGETMLAEILEPASAKFSWAPAPSPRGERSNKGINRLQISLKSIKGRTRLAVLFTPGAKLADSGHHLPRLENLVEWKNRP